MSLTVGSLFAGIGGFDLAARGMGWTTVWYSEIDPYACAVMARHFPEAVNLGDIRSITNPPSADVLCGGFPCQDISVAGTGAGIGGLRSGLWREYERVVGEVRPRYVVVENSAALLRRGLGEVLGGLAALGYNAEWDCVSACSVGAPHLRRRLLIVAHTNSVNGRTRLRTRDPRPPRAIPGVDRFSSARASWAARMADPSALYGGANGVSSPVDRVRCLGNAVVPQVAAIAFGVIAAREAA